MGSNKNKNSKRDMEENPRTPKKSETSRKPPHAPDNSPTPSIPIRSPHTPAPRPNHPHVLPTISPIVPPEDMLRPSFRKSLKGESLERLESTQDVFKREKRNFSQPSSTSAEYASGHKLTKMEQETDNESDMKYHLQVVRQKLKVADAAYEAKKATLRELRASWQDGTLTMTRGEFQKEMKCIEREIGELLVEGIHMRTSTYEIAAKEVDTERWNKLAYAEDCSYIELLASRLKEPSGSTVTMKNPRDPNKQDRWRKAVIKAYGSEHARGTRVWCPINQQYEAPGGITAAHIVRYNVGELAAAHLFGPLDDSAGHIWSIRNGIPLTSRYEEMLDDGRIAIVPTKDGKDLMVAVLDEAERSTLLLDPTAMDPDQVLHGRTLMFLNDHRPALRYLYFCFAMNLLRRQKFEVDGWWKDRIEYADTPFFPTPGKWVRETTLRKLAIRIGYLPAGEADNFAAMTQARNPEGLSREGEAAVGEEAKEAKEAKEEDKEEDKEEENKEEEFTISRVHYAFLDLDPAPEPD